MSEHSEIDALMKKLQSRDMAVLVNAKNEAQKKAGNYPTAENVRALAYVNKAIEDLVRLSRDDTCGIKMFENVPAIKEYLDDEGWQVSQSGLYKHKKEGKLAPSADGAYHQKAVDTYARTWLKRKATGKKIADEVEELQRSKLKKELEKLETENTRARIKLEVEQGKYIEKDRMFLEMAARAGVLDAGLNHWIQTGTAEWIRLVDGDLKKAG